MNTIKTLLTFLFIFILTVPSYSQDNANTPQRTPEQEAAKQTEKLQGELNMNANQAKQVYDINLKYARQRQISNTRTQAMERMKNKNAEIEQILNSEQNNRLQSKRYERSTLQNQDINGNQLPTNASGFRSTPDNRNKATFRYPSPNDNSQRSTFHTTRPDYQSGTQQNQNLQRNSSTPPRTSEPENSQQPIQNQTQTTIPPRRTETTTPPPSNNRYRPQRSESTMPRKAETPARTNRN